MASSPSGFDKFFSLISLVLFSGILMLFEQDHAANDLAEGERTAQMVFFILYVFMIATMLPHLNAALSVCRKSIPLCLLVALSVLSALWSSMPALTLRQSGALVGTSLFGVYFATRFSQKEQLELLAQAFAAIALASLLIAAFMPERGVMSVLHEGAWQGIYRHKNALGRMMLLASLVFHQRIFDTATRRSGLCGGALCLLIIIKTTSRTSLLSWGLLLACLLTYRWTQRKNAKMAALAVMTLLLASAAALIVLGANQETAFNYMGRDLSFTGRTPLWYMVWQSILQKPWLGYGLGAFWSNESMLQNLGWSSPHAHNGFLDVGLSLGFVGFGVFLLAFSTAWTRAYKISRLLQTPESLWPLSLLTFMIFANLTESTLMVRNDIVWVLFVSAAASLSQDIEYAGTGETDSHPKDASAS